MPLAQAAINILDNAACIDSSTMTNSLQNLLQKHQAPDDLVIQISTKSDNDKQISLEITVSLNNSRPLLTRSYQLQPHECKSTTEIITTVIDLFLTQFPVYTWQIAFADAFKEMTANLDSVAKPNNNDGEPPPETQPLPQPPNIDDTQQLWNMRFLQTTITPLAAINPTNTELEANIAAGFGKQQHAFWLGLLVRTSYPKNLATGKFITITPLLSLGWYLPLPTLSMCLGLSSGMIFFKGINFSTNSTTKLFWYEAFTEMTFRHNRFIFGPKIALSPLRHWAYINGRSQTGKHANLRAGLTIGIITDFAQ